MEEVSQEFMDALNQAIKDEYEYWGVRFPPCKTPLDYVRICEMKRASDRRHGRPVGSYLKRMYNMVHGLPLESC